MNSANISIDGKNVTLKSILPLDLTKGRFRIFFASVLGWRPSQLGPMYTAELTAASGRLIEEAQRYLAAQGINLLLDSATADLLEKRRQAEDDIATARAIGDKIRAGDFSLELPKEFKRDLKPYQMAAVAHLVGLKHAANFSVPGSGKTTMVLAAFAQLKAAGIVSKILVVGPRSCFIPWEEEFEGCFKRKPHCIRFNGPANDRSIKYEEFNADLPELGLVTYQTASNDAVELAALLQRHSIMLVLDESHYIKRLSGGQWSSTMLELAPYATKRVVLSGTPVPNGLEDLWSQMTFLWPNPPALGSREKYSEIISKAGDDAVELMREELRPLYWRVRKSDVALPEPEFHRIPLSMRPYQAAIYRALAVKVLAEIESRPEEREKLRNWRKARMVRMLQVASNPSLLAKDSPEFRVPPLDAAGLSVEKIVERYQDYEIPVKLSYTRDLVKSLIDQGLKVVIWTAFVHNIEMLSGMLREYQPRVIHGSVPKDPGEDTDFNRETMIRQFKEDDQFKLLIANPAACAESISLHRACQHAIYLDRTFNGAQYMQSLDRIHRLGLERDQKVHYYLLLAEGTVDEIIDERLQAKQQRLRSLLEDDLSSINLDTEEDEQISEEIEEEVDFTAMVEFLRSRYGEPNSD